MDITSVVCYCFFFLFGLVVGNIMSVQHNIDVMRFFFTIIWPQLTIYIQSAQVKLFTVYNHHIFPFINENFLKKATSISDDGKDDFDKDDFDHDDLDHR